METMNKQVERADYQVNSFLEFRTYDASICIMTRILDLMSGRWKPVILFLIKNDINRFGLLQKSMPRISKKVLTNQLRELEADHLISRVVVEARHPQVVVYHLTERGISLRELIDGIINWGITNLPQNTDTNFVSLYRRA
jgi:DNA-binding HxlR family transcriptional regulator